METTKTYRPKRGVFESTLACNLNCRHCGSSAGKARSDELTTEECKSLFEQLRGIGLEWITISGGEPMARPDWAELITLAKDTGMGVGMFTNAIAMDDDAAKRAKDAGIDSIGLSIDGLEATHDHIRGRKGHFKILEAAMERFQNNGISYGAVTTICNDNLAQLEEMQQYISQSGAYSWQVQLGSDMGNLSHYPEMLIAPRQLPKLEKRIANMIVSGPLKIYCADSLGYYGPHEKILRNPIGGKCFSGCGAGKTNIGIECNGNIKGCLSIMAGYNKKGKNFVEGNIRETPLHEIWNRPGAFSYSRNWSRADLTGFCATCAYAEKCKGGCLGKRVSDGGVTENQMCVYRVLMEQSQEPKKLAQAAAVFFALAMGASNSACDNADTPTPLPLYGIQPTDTESDTATGGDTDTGIDTVTEADTESELLPPYNIPPLDTETEEPALDSDTYDVDAYGIMPDSEVDVPLYGILPTDTEPVDEYGVRPPQDTEVDTATEVEEDTVSVDKYGIQPIDTEIVTLYGIMKRDND